jgi:hypothetical protein
MLDKEILLFISGLGAVQSIFFALYTITKRHLKFVENLLLTFLFAALALRVGKSVLWYFYRDVSITILNIGFAAHFAISPLLFLYLYHFS